MSPRTAIRYWLPPILWTAVIFAASSASFSSTQSAPWLATIVRSILGHSLSPDLFEALHIAIRKAGHLIEYGILGALLYRAFRAEDRTRWNLRWAIFGVAVATIIAALDEWHQMYVPSRTSSPMDMAVDSLGAMVAQILIRVTQRSRIP